MHMARILIVDDNAIDQRLVSGLLTKHLEVDILFAKDGTEALTKIADLEPDLVLTDLNMPQMNGLELVAQMREKYPLIPVILMTAAGSEQIAVQAITAGASSYVSKRRLSQDLCETTKHVLELSGERRTQSLIQQRQQRWETSLVVENDFALVTGVASYLMQNLRGMDVCAPAEEVRIGVAIAEALMNAYFHGNLEVPSSLRDTSSDKYYEAAQQRSQQSPYQDRRIRISARFSRGHAVISVSDDGRGFDTSNLPDPTDPRSIERTHGRGLFLMRSFMDEIRFNESGSTVTMVKQATRPAAKA